MLSDARIRELWENYSPTQGIESFARAIEAEVRKETTWPAIEDDEVLVALKRPEGYEDVHPELVSEDAINSTWPEYRTIWPKEPA